MQNTAYRFKRMRKHDVVLAAIAAIGCLASFASADSAVAWGDNSNAQLGVGSTISGSNSPLVVSGMSSGVTAVAAGGIHGLALQNGGLYAWGVNDQGQLGDGNNIISYTPVAVSGMSSGVTAFTGGFEHSLAMQGGAVYAWGDNNYGELGDGNNTNSDRPVPVSGMSTGVTAIAAGGLFSLVIRDGGIYGWGNDSFGQLGNDASIYSVTTPVAANGMSSGVTAIAAGDAFSMAIQNGALYGWGTGYEGQLGDGVSGANSEKHTPVAVSGMSSGVTAIAGGGNHSLAIKDGVVYAWGYNADGQLGIGNTTSTNTPMQVDPADLTNIVSIAAGEFSSYALSSDGSLWVWGDNSDGELGLGTANGHYTTPQHLLAPTGYQFTSIETNADATNAVATLAPVPEPASVSLLIVPVIGLARRSERWFRQRSG